MIRKRTHAPDKQRPNYWKWAFGLLLALVLGSGLFLVHQATTTTTVQKQVTTQKLTGRFTTLNVRMNKEQLNGVVNHYLTQQQKGKKIKYFFNVGQSVALVGTTKILGQNVSFSLYTRPTVTAGGNIVLHAKSVAIGSLNVPPSFILNYVKNNYNLGKWMTINSRAKTIMLHLSEVSLKQGVRIRAQKIDLQKDDFRFRVDIPLESAQ
ncbi:YpmS family protein [Liquorilactobacillus satsumensis]|uniref:YpmS family protein n=1 Tax=Liquorilactobacillus satsumensis TaxID=259059 RepID=UPI0021C46A58|nr:YpmS family protein [Liquorilactobacillus satsumensis]MCP9327851.1 YpmS family protein [Liquorilactobacillus satsumensis]